MILAGCVPSCTVVTQEWQAPVMCKRNESATAARLAFVIDIAEHAIASILVIPHFAIRQTCREIKAVEERLVLVEGLMPSCMLANRGRHAEFLIIAQVNAFS